MSGAERLCALTELPEWGARGFKLEGQASVFVVRQGAALYAYRDLCPHYGDTSLPWRKDAYLDPLGKRIMCAAHGALFDIDSGLCTSGPCLGESLTRVPVQISESGDVLAILSCSNNGEQDLE